MVTPDTALHMIAPHLHPETLALADGMPARHRLRCALFIAGAAVMVLQIVGTRIIGPHFGAGLSVWTALITVTLVALAWRSTRPAEWNASLRNSRSRPLPSGSTANLVYI